jgi:hypothetical protein
LLHVLRGDLGRILTNNQYNKPCHTQRRRDADQNRSVRSIKRLSTCDIPNRPMFYSKSRQDVVLYERVYKYPMKCNGLQIVLIPAFSILLCHVICNVAYCIRYYEFGLFLSAYSCVVFYWMGLVFWKFLKIIRVCLNQNTCCFPFYYQIECS